jgi:hypothetical protein
VASDETICASDQNGRAFLDWWHGIVVTKMVLCGGTSLEWGLEGCKIKEDMVRGYLAWEGYSGCISNQFIINCP